MRFLKYQVSAAIAGTTRMMSMANCTFSKQHGDKNAQHIVQGPEHVEQVQAVMVAMRLVSLKTREWIYPTGVTL
jgi:hypothetical protein